MKILLTGINSKYIHSNLAIRYLYEYAKEYSEHLNLKEYTINQSLDFVLRDLYKENPDVICLSTYIWNIEYIKELSVEIKKILPNITIILGGPEVSFDGKKLMEEITEIDLIIKKEGEETFKKLVESLTQNKNINDIRGIIYREKNSIFENPDMPLINIDDMPFVYKKGLKGFKNRIIYYETSRGCPYNCSYCLSSIEKRVRFKSLDLVFKELQFFLDNKVKQVKLIDRTFNANKKRTIKIWKYLLKNDNGVTNFHFEITGDIITDEMLELLKDAREGFFQFEIGVQTTNKKVLSNINRKMNFKRLSEVVRNINNYNNIHLHLDLIAGLPGENYISFEKSFNAVYSLNPHEFQLGFLKLIKGSELRINKNKEGLISKEKPPYEILKTKDLSYEDMLKLKMIENMLDHYYNSGRYITVLRYMIKKFKSPFEFYEQLAKYYQENKYHLRSQSKLKMFEILFEFYTSKYKEDMEIIKDLFKFDIYRHERANKLPKFIKNNKKYNKKIKDFYKNKKELRRKTHIDFFQIDVTEYLKKGIIVFKETAVMFNYDKKDKILNKADIIKKELI